MYLYSINIRFKTLDHILCMVSECNNKRPVDRLGLKHIVTTLTLAEACEHWALSTVPTVTLDTIDTVPTITLDSSDTVPTVT